MSSNFKICNNCGCRVNINANFCPECKSTSFKFTSSNVVKNNNKVAISSNSQSDMVHKIFYNRYGNYYVLSKAKFVSIAVFIYSLLTLYGLDSFIIALVFSLIAALLTFVIGYGLHKILGRDRLPVNVVKRNNYGLANDIKNLLFHWQNKNTGEHVFSKTKSISILIFIIFTGIGIIFAMEDLPSLPFVVITFGLIFAVPTFVIGYVIHKLTNPNPVNNIPQPPTPVVEMPKTVEKPKIIKTVPEFNKYKTELESLSDEFKSKEKSARELIEKRFQPPQITYNRFISAVDNCSKIFTQEKESIENILNLATGNNERISSEINSRFETIKMITSKLEDLINELVLNTGKSEKLNSDVKNVIEDMEDLIDSVKNYE